MPLPTTAFKWNCDNRSPIEIIDVDSFAERRNE